MAKLAEQAERYEEVCLPTVLSFFGRAAASGWRVIPELEIKLNSCARPGPGMGSPPGAASEL